MIAVPTPAAGRENHRIQRIRQDCGAAAVIANPATAASMPEFAGMMVIDPSQISNGEASHYQSIKCSPDDIAILQYTSGSTGAPRGTKVTRANLSHNSWLISAVRAHEPYLGVIWLPPYHDMGLVGGLLHPAFTGCRHVLMSPLHFLQRPIRWLRAITRYRASLCVAPDFAFRFCVDRVTAEEKRELDLSTMRFAYCGAEVVRKETLDRFEAAFGAVGFRREAFLPCYGLAESTLLVTAKHGVGLPAEASFTGSSLEEGIPVVCEPSQPPARSLISCGRIAGDLDLRIVDPCSRREVPRQTVGEIWVRGRSVASGYWSDGRADMFCAVIDSDSALRQYLRTGDLGFLWNDELFVTGRIKDMVVVRGRNLHAEDLEQSAAQGSPLLAAGACAAVSLDSGQEEQLAIIAEIEARRLPAEPLRNAELEKILAGIRNAVIHHHGVAPKVITLVRRGVLPRTTSGKLRRHACRCLASVSGPAILKRWESASEEMA